MQKRLQVNCLANTSVGRQTCRWAELRRVMMEEEREKERKKKRSGRRWKMKEENETKEL